VGWSVVACGTDNCDASFLYEIVDFSRNGISAIRDAVAGDAEVYDLHALACQPLESIDENIFLG
jgi:hypothetical protein